MHKSCYNFIKSEVIRLSNDENALHNHFSLWAFTDLEPDNEI